MSEDEARHIYKLMVITAWADGNMDASETKAADDLLASQPELRTVSGLADLAREAKETLDEHGLKGAVAREAAGIDGAAARELAFYCCARVLEADHAIAHQEFQVLNRLKSLFSLTDGVVGKLLARSRAGL